ncbi:YkvA family protein [uncultured Phascolarctobacterium sp.]|uniref:YkvA family protein n=1 Tax=uncultured Phascolarctobacterium sp. TaxID=512296 RepID=UPI0027DEA266|nr:YkvA family protein [uncultured Phascolarctobacterium sp.]
MTEDKDFDKKKINENELRKYADNYSEEDLLHKISKFGAHIGLELLYKVAQLWCVLQKPEVPAKDKALIMGALGYLISPLDFIPDLTPVLGYSDDLVAISFAMLKVQGYIDDEVKAEAKALLAKVFDGNAVAKL